MGRLGLEPRTSRLKAECSTTELATHAIEVKADRCFLARLALRLRPISFVTQTDYYRSTGTAIEESTFFKSFGDPL